jgi:peptidoglycan/LPS O-acetylase OafA/YrhL
MTQNNTNNNFLPSLQSIRFLAAAGVVLHHYSHAWNHSGLSVFFNQLGAWGVSIFFILSGFVLMWNYSPDVRAKKFILRRFVRIYPLHFICLSMSLAAFFTVGSPLAGYVYLGHVWEILSNYLLIQSWLPLQWTSEYTYIAQAWNGVAWSLSCEWFFYLCAPVVFRILYASKLNHLGNLMIIGYLALLLLHMFCIRKQYTSLSYYLHISPVARSYEFLLGAVGALLVRNTLNGQPLRCDDEKKWEREAIYMRIRFILTLALALLLAPYAATVLFGINFFTVFLFVPGSFLLVIALSYMDLTGSSWKPFIHPFLLLLGNSSYALYMIHSLFLGVWFYVFKVIFTWPNESTALWVISNLCFVICAVMLSVLIHKLFEDPVRKKLTISFGLNK